MKTAYSYIRFSTPEQAKGDSTRRQTDSAARYCEREGLALDTSLDMLDPGISGYHGKNSKTGALAGFLRAVTKGIVKPGSILIVEDIDRLSRQEPLDSIDLIREIVGKGIVLVTLIDNQKYTRETLRSNPGQLFTLLGKCIGAHDYSRKLSERVTASWQGRRAAIIDRKQPVTSICPFWIRLDKAANKYILIPERANVVRRIVQLATGGMGGFSIARTLNADGIQTPTKRSKRWTDSMVVEFLNSRLLLGEYQPRKYDQQGGRENDGPAVKGYYPAVVSEAEWFALLSVRAKNKRIVKGRNGNGLANLFGRLLIDGVDGSAVHFASKRPGHRILRSAGMMAGTSTTATFPYPAFESAFLSMMSEIELTEQREPSRVAELEGRVEDLKSKAAKVRALTANANGQQFDELLALLSDIQKQTTQATGELELAKAAEHRPQHSTRDIAALVESMKAQHETAQHETRARIRQAIQALCQTVKVYAWHNNVAATSQVAVCEVQFKDGMTRVFGIRVDRGQAPIRMGGLKIAPLGKINYDAIGKAVVAASRSNAAATFDRAFAAAIVADMKQARRTA